MNASLDDHNRFAVIKIVAIYAVISILWIYLSDTILSWVIHDRTIMKYIAISKGILFVIITASLLYVLIYRHMNQLMKINHMLQDRERLLQSTATNIPGAMCQFYVFNTGNYGVSYVSDRVKDIFGLSTDPDTFFASFSAHVMEEDRNRFWNSLRDAVSTGSSWKFEGRFIKPDGELLWFQGMATQQIIKERRLFYCVLLDITERKRVEQALKESEANYRQLFENAPAAIYRIDFKTGKILKANDVFYEYLGWKREDVTSFSPYDVLTEESKKLFFDRLEKISLGEKVSETVECDIIDKNGKQWCLYLHNKLVYDADGHVVASDVVAHDITERKQAEMKLQETLDSLRRVYAATIQVLVSVVEARDPYTAGHQIRTADIARSIAREMGLSDDQIDGIRMAGTIHDIGKLSIPAEILSKPTKLTDIEYALIKEHARRGYEILKDVESPWPLAEIVYQHHERINGSGYPRNLKGDEIILEARIMGVADVVEAMGSHRPYRASLGIDVALAEIEKNKGIFYDSSVVDACLRLFREKGYQLK